MKTRAVTFYQLGAVLYDLIERRPIFADHETPYARLVNAVQHTQPTFTHTDVPDLVRVAQNSLVKSASVRLQLVNWEAFLQPEMHTPSGLPSKQRIAQARKIAGPAISAEGWQRRWNALQRSRELVNNVEMWIRQWCVGEQLLPPFEVIRPAALGPSNHSLGLHFRPAAGSNLDHHLLIHVEIKVLDADAQAIELLADAVLSESSPFPTDRHTLSIYRGLATERDLRQVLENTIYPVFEAVTLHSAPLGRIDLTSTLTPDSRT